MTSTVTAVHPQIHYLNKLPFLLISSSSTPCQEGLKSGAELSALSAAFHHSNHIKIQATKTQEITAKGECGIQN